MSNDRNKQLKQSIRSITKKIGQAIKEHDHNEVSNLRARRGTFIKLLIDEFDEYYIIIDGKSKFVSLEEAQEYYSQPENNTEIATRTAISDVFKGREYLRNRLNILVPLSPEKVKEQMLREIEEQMGQMEETINKLLDNIGKPAIDFKEVDEKKDDDFLHGIDLSSLE